MFHDHTDAILKQEEFAALGTDAVAYVRKITTEEVLEAFPNITELEEGRNYWALFAANGDPLVLADKETDIMSSAFYNDLSAVLPN